MLSGCLLVYFAADGSDIYANQEMKTGKELIGEWSAFLETESSSAFHALYAHYHDYLTYIGLKKGATTEKAKDCINELFLYILENRPALFHIKDHHNYLVTAFLRKLFRKEHFCAEESLALDDLLDSSIYPSAEAQLIRHQAQDQVSRILKKYVGELTESQANMIYQKFYLGLSYEEISTANNVTVKTVYNTIYTAVERLRRMVGKANLGELSVAIATLSLLFLFFLKNL